MLTTFNFWIDKEEESSDSSEESEEGGEEEETANDKLMSVEDVLTQAQQRKQVRNDENFFWHIVKFYIKWTETINLCTLLL